MKLDSLQISKRVAEARAAKDAMHNAALGFLFAEKRSPDLADAALARFRQAAADHKRIAKGLR